MKLRSLAAFLAATVGATPAPVSAGELAGPARFCGYSPIIDLLDGESVTTLQGGIHGGSFRWDGVFGTLEVHGIGWASRPKGRIVSQQSDLRPARFAQRRTDGRYQIAIWNGRHGAAYFTSGSRFSREQIAAIDRVRLFEEGETPEGCKLRTIFSWD
jgi:hypothetical protein